MYAFILSSPIGKIAPLPPEKTNGLAVTEKSIPPYLLYRILRMASYFHVIKIIIVYSVAKDSLFIESSCSWLSPIFTCITLNIN